MKRILVPMTVLSLAACTSDPYQGVYEGIKANQDAKRSPTERAMTPAPSYDEYKKERDTRTVE